MKLTEEFQKLPRARRISALVDQLGMEIKAADDEAPTTLARDLLLSLQNLTQLVMLFVQQQKITMFC